MHSTWSVPFMCLQSASAPTVLETAVHYYKLQVYVVEKVFKLLDMRFLPQACWLLVLLVNMKMGAAVSYKMWSASTLLPGVVSQKTVVHLSS